MTKRFIPVVLIAALLLGVSGSVVLAQDDPAPAAQAAPSPLDELRQQVKYLSARVDSTKLRVDDLTVRTPILERITVEGNADDYTALTKVCPFPQNRTTSGVSLHSVTLTEGVWVWEGWSHSEGNHWTDAYTYNSVGNLLFAPSLHSLNERSYEVLCGRGEEDRPSWIPHPHEVTCVDDPLSDGATKGNNRSEVDFHRGLRHVNDSWSSFSETFVVSHGSRFCPPGVFDVLASQTGMGDRWVFHFTKLYDGEHLRGTPPTTEAAS